MNTQKQTIPLGRDAFRIVVIAIIGSTLAGLTYLYQALLNSSWQAFALAGDMLALLVAGLVSLVLIRRGRAVLGIWVVVVAAQITTVATTVFVSGLGLVLGLGIAVLSFMTASLALPSRHRGAVILTGVIAGGVCGLLDSLGPSYRLPASVLVKIGIPAILGVTVVVYGYFLTPVFKSFNLRGKIISAFLVVSLLSVGLLTYVTTEVVRAELTSNVGANLKRLAASTGQSIGDQLSTQVEAISALALSKNVLDKVDLANSNYIGLDPVAIQADIDRLDKQWLAADAAQNDNDPLVQSRLNNLLGSQLRGFRDSSPDHVEIFVTDVYGGLVAATNRTSDYYQSDEAWWQATYNNGLGAIYIGQPDYDQSSGTTSCIIAIPLYDANHNVIGVLRTTYRMNTLAKILDSTHLGQTGVNEVLFPNDSWLEANGEVVILDPNIATNFRQAEAAEYVTLSSEGFDRLVSLEQITTSNPKYTDVISNLGWKVITAQGSAEALQPVSGAVRTSLLTALAILFVSLFLAVFVAQSLSIPIIRLTSVAEQVRAGDLSSRAVIETQDEVGRLAQTFNDMTTQLNDLIGSLERRVAERTKDLEVAQKVVAKRAAELQSVAEIATKASQSVNLQDMLQTVVDLTKSSYNLYHAHIYLLDDSKTQLVLTSGAGDIGRQMVEQKRVIPLEQVNSLVARAARLGDGAIANDVTKEPDFLSNPLLPDTKAEMAIPISIGGTVLGVLDVQANYINRFTDEDIAIMTTLAQQVASSLQNIWNFAQAQHQAERESMLNTISHKIQNATTVEAVLQIAAREIGTALKSKNTRVIIKDIELANARQGNS